MKPKKKKRSIGQEIIQGLRELKAGKTGRVTLRQLKQCLFVAKVPGGLDYLRCCHAEDHKGPHKFDDAQLEWKAIDDAGRVTK